MAWRGNELDRLRLMGALNFYSDEGDGPEGGGPGGTGSDTSAGESEAGASSGGSDDGDSYGGFDFSTDRFGIDEPDPIDTTGFNVDFGSPGIADDFDATDEFGSFEGFGGPDSGESGSFLDTAIDFVKNMALGAVTAANPVAGLIATSLVAGLTAKPGKQAQAGVTALAAGVIGIGLTNALSPALNSLTQKAAEFGFAKAGVTGATLGAAGVQSAAKAGIKSASQTLGREVGETFSELAAANPNPTPSKVSLEQDGFGPGALRGGEQVQTQTQTRTPTRAASSQNLLSFGLDFQTNPALEARSFTTRRSKRLAAPEPISQQGLTSVYGNDLIKSYSDIYFGGVS